MKIGNLNLNYYIVVAVTSWFIAQLLKVILTFFTSKKIALERFVGSGGMPSSHSAFTVSAAVSLGRVLGYTSAEFALAFIFSAVVMTDAMGVRRAAGEQAKTLNKILLELPDFPWFAKKDKKPVEVSLSDLENAEEGIVDEEPERVTATELKEFLGHTPLEVVAGCILGIVIALIFPLPN